MELHNAYTVRGASGACTALNAMSDDFWQKAATHVYWAKFLALIDDTGERVCAPATLTFINADASHGGTLRAQYAAAVECVFGRRYVSVALCCEESAGSEMSVAHIDYTGDGEEAEITAVISLAVTFADDVCFCAGDNPLVRRLLGCGEEIALRMGWGTCTYPARICVRTTHLIGGFLPVEIAVQEDGMAIASQGETYGSELVLFSGDTPLLRALRPYTYNVRAKYVTVPEQNAVLIDDNLPETVFNVRIDDAALVRTDICRVGEAAVPVRADYVRELGAAGRIVADPSGEYVAFVTASYAEVYKVDVLEPELCFRIATDAKFVFMCRGGALAVWETLQLTVYEPNDAGEYVSHSVAVPCGNDCIVVREGSRYHCAYRRSSAFYRFYMTMGGSAVQCEQARLTTSLFVMGRCGDALVFGDKMLRVRMIDVDLSAEYACDAITDHVVSRTQLGVGDCFAACRESGNTSVYDYVHNSLSTVEGLYTANGRLLYNEQGAYIYDYYHGLRRLEGEYDLTGVTGACLAGDGLFAVRDGRLYSYYVSGTRLALRVPVGNVGATLFYNAREKVLSGVGQTAKFLFRPCS